MREEKNASLVVRLEMEVRFFFLQNLIKTSQEMKEKKRALNGCHGVFEFGKTCL